MSNSRDTVRLDPALAEALNGHVSIEAKSGFQYHAMSSWAEVRGLTGTAAWLRKEAEGEMDHMLQFVGHLNDRGYQATFSAMEAPASEWPDMAAMFEQVVDMERTLCQQIDHLIDAALSQKDHFTVSFLQGFVPQQISDMAEADEILDRIKIAGSDGHATILIDQELKVKAGA